MSDLQRALEIAVSAHKNQQEKNGSPYVLHPIRLMLAVESPEAKIAALLHDVVEDTGVEMEDLVNEGFGEDIISALKLLTHDDGSEYGEYINRIVPNEIAREVKIADLQDNMDIRRIPALKPKDLARIDKYHASWLKLTNADAGS